MTIETVRETASGGCCGAGLTQTVEDYLKTIFAITSLGDRASTSAIAARMNVTPPSVTAMVHRLRDGGLAEQANWGQVALTDHGLRHAHAVVRRHRLLETFLHRVLGVAWDEIHCEAEVLEHHLSPRLEHLIDAALGFPERDPHGDPIPRPFATHEEHGETPLAQTRPGDAFRVQRVFDHDSGALRRLAEFGIRPGALLEVDRLSSDMGPMLVRVGDRDCLLSRAVVNLIHGRIEPSATAS